MPHLVNAALEPHLDDRVVRLLTAVHVDPCHRLLHLLGVLELLVRAHGVARVLAVVGLPKERKDVARLDAFGNVLGPVEVTRLSRRVDDDLPRGELVVHPVNLLLRAAGAKACGKEDP